MSEQLSEAGLKANVEYYKALTRKVEHEYNKQINNRNRALDLLLKSKGL